MMKNIEFDMTDKKISNNLVLNRDYRGVNKEVWSMLHRIYGGGPSIIREFLDIYSEDMSEEYEKDIKNQKHIEEQNYQNRQKFI
jgi:hypothetical protein